MHTNPFPGYIYLMCRVLEHVIDELRVAGVMKINSKRSEVFIFQKSDYREFIKLILLLFCYSEARKCGY